MVLVSTRSSLNIGVAARDGAISISPVVLLIRLFFYTFGVAAVLVEDQMGDLAFIVFDKTYR